MMNKFWQSEANKFTLYGAIFGLLFPVIATLLQAFLKHGNFSMESMIDVQFTDPLLWIIDSAPFWLGLFARFAGRRQDNLKAIIRQSAAAEQGITEEHEDSQQFAGLLTFLGIGLIGVVLFAFSIWLQRLILTGDTLPALEQTTDNTDESATAGIANSALVGSQVVVATATIAPVVINVQPVAVSPTSTTMPPTFTPTPTEAQPVVVEPTPLPPTPEVPPANSGNADAGATTESNAAANPAAPRQAEQIILGLAQRDVDCQFFTELAATAWQGMGVAVEIRPYADANQLFDDLTATPNSGTLFITFCFVDPEDRPYLREHLSQLQIIGKAYWETEGKKLLTVSNAGTPNVLRQQQPLIYNFLVNQTYDAAAIGSQTPADWLTQNQATVQSWMDRQ